VNVINCESCGAEMFFAFTDNGKRAPINAVPDPAGLFRLVQDSFPAKVTTKPVELGQDDDGVRYTSHFATCPHADEWRNKQRTAKATTPGPRYRKYTRS